jgi:hypothetical protein
LKSLSTSGGAFKPNRERDFAAVRDQKGRKEPGEHSKYRQVIEGRYEVPVRYLLREKTGYDTNRAGREVYPQQQSRDDENRTAEDTQ